jgi:curved DNA-binding protein CbpA
MTPVQEQNCYQRLGVTPSAAPDQIKRAYRARLMQTHPALHKGIDPADFQLIKRAYEVLANPDERRRYDMLTGLGSQPARPPVYRRSFGLALASLDAGLKATIVSFDELAEQVDASRRRAG